MCFASILHSPDQRPEFNGPANKCDVQSRTESHRTVAYTHTMQLYDPLKLGGIAEGLPDELLAGYVVGLAAGGRRGEAQAAPLDDPVVPALLHVGRQFVPAGKLHHLDGVVERHGLVRHLEAVGDAVPDGGEEVVHEEAVRGVGDAGVGGQHLVVRADHELPLEVDGEGDFRRRGLGGREELELGVELRQAVLHEEVHEVEAEDVVLALRGTGAEGGVVRLELRHVAGEGVEVPVGGREEDAELQRRGGNSSSCVGRRIGVEEGNFQVGQHGLASLDVSRVDAAG